MTCLFLLLLLFPFSWRKPLQLKARAHKLHARSARPHRCRTWSCVKRDVANYGWFELLEEVVHPFSGWYLCQFYLGSEHNAFLGQDAFDLLKRRRRLKELPRCDEMFEMARIFVESVRLNDFVEQCLPTLKVHIILITGRWHVPAVGETTSARKILASPFIYRWFLQNPFTQHEKIVQLPYGVMHSNLPSFAKFAADVDLTAARQFLLLNLHLGKTNQQRAQIKSGDKRRLLVHEYYARLSQAKFIISPAGDRPDCHRHLEAIGLGVRPICNCPEHFKALYGDTMLFADIHGMNRYIEDPNLLKGTHIFSHNITTMDQNLLSIGYWDQKIQQEIAQFEMEYPWSTRVSTSN